MAEQPSKHGTIPQAASIVDKIIRDGLNADEKKAIIEENIQEWRDCLDRIAATPDGQFMFKKLVRYSGVFTFQDKIDPADLVQREAYRKVWLQLFRPYINSTNLIEIEHTIDLTKKRK